MISVPPHGILPVRSSVEAKARYFMRESSLKGGIKHLQIQGFELEEIAPYLSPSIIKIPLRDTPNNICKRPTVVSHKFIRKRIPPKGTFTPHGHPFKYSRNQLSNINRFPAGPDTLPRTASAKQRSHHAPVVQPTDRHEQASRSHHPNL